LNDDALVHLSQQSGGREGKVSLCGACAAELGVDNPEAMDWKRIGTIGLLIDGFGRWSSRDAGPLDEPPA
jgi:hypothetical protein